MVTEVAYYLEVYQPNVTRQEAKQFETQLAINTRNRNCTPWVNNGGSNVKMGKADNFLHLRPKERASSYFSKVENIPFASVIKQWNKTRVALEGAARTGVNEASDS